MNLNLNENLNTSNLAINLDDMEFFKEWSEGTLDFPKWTHKSHIRMAFIMIVQNYPNLELIQDKVRKGIQFFNGLHKEKLKVGYHETITLFWIDQVYEAIKRQLEYKLGFEEFIQKEAHLMSTNLLFEFYSKEYLFTNEARAKYFEPDLKKIE